jgi:hypothetical protein
MYHCAGHAGFGLHIMPCWHDWPMFVARVYTNMGTPVLLIVMCHCIGCVLRCWLARPSPLRKPLALSWLCFSSSWAPQLPRMPDMREIELVANTHLLNQLNTHATIRYTHIRRGRRTSDMEARVKAHKHRHLRCTRGSARLGLATPTEGGAWNQFALDVNQLHLRRLPQLKRRRHYHRLMCIH